MVYFRMEKPTVDYEKKIFSFSRLKEPPREVPFMLWLAMVFNTVGFPMSFTFLFILTALLSYAHPVDMRHQFMLDKSSKTTEGTIVRKKFIGHESGFDGNYKYIYWYKIPDGMLYSGKSQSNDDIPAEQVITVEYLEQKPQVSRMKGTKRNFLLPYFAMFIIFAIYLLKVAQGFITAGALKNGELADAEVKGVEEVDEGDQKAYRITLEFRDKNRETRSFIHKTIHKENLTNDPTDLVLYDPVNSKNVWPVDEFPIPVNIDMDGGWTPPGMELTLRTIAHLLLFITPVIYGVVRFFE